MSPLNEISEGTINMNKLIFMSTVGVVTRCPLQLKLRRIKTEDQWKAVISYRTESIENKKEFCDPLQVEQYVREG